MPRPEKQGPKIGLLDVETAPTLVWVWGLFKQTVGLEQIVQDEAILAACYKWYGEKRCHYIDTFEQESVFDDHDLTLALWEFLDAADIVVTQNGRRFDHKKINARFIHHGLPPPSPYKIVDTLEIAKRNFGFISKKLQWMTSRLCKKVQKRAHEKFPGFKLWTEFMAKNPAARKEMRLYNVDDVRSMEELYTIFLPWISNHPNHGNYYSDETPRCNKCGSVHVVRNGTYFTDVGRYQRFRCGDCGGHVRGRVLINSTSKRKSLLMGVA